MRVLNTIPHIFNPSGSGTYASVADDPAPRVAALTACLGGLCSLSRQKQFYFDYDERSERKSTGHKGRMNIDIILCSVRDLNVTAAVPGLGEIYRLEVFDVDPMYTGFECQKVLRNHLGQYDYYGYLEDDLIINDPYFFAKLLWFNKHAGDGVVLQPNRFEMTGPPENEQVYIDPDYDANSGRRPGYAHNFDDKTYLKASFLQQEIGFTRAKNPHSGRFFLNRTQMQHYADQPYFEDQDVGFFGPLESAASLGLMRTFRVYKPAFQHADFLQIQHYGTAWAERARTVTLGKSGTVGKP
jgi:hypothetical protein